MAVLSDPASNPPPPISSPELILGPPPGTEPRRVLGVRVDDIGMDEALARLEEMILTGPPRQICTVNPTKVMIARSDPIFATILDRCALCLSDGAGLAWASHMLRRPLRERVIVLQLAERLAALAARHGWRLFLFGHDPNITADAAAVLAERYPGLRIAGTQAGTLAGGKEEDMIVERIRRSKADILLVGFISPQQDKWIARNLPRLGVPLAISVGPVLDVISGKRRRAPPWTQEVGLEWLFYLWPDPARRPRLLSLPLFVLLVLWHRFTGR